jgi:hypothetical protein
MFGGGAATTNGVTDLIPAVSNNLLADQFTSPTVLLSLSKENSSYNGNCVQISSSTGTSQVNIGFSGTSIDMTALSSALAGGARYVDTWYDQSGNGNNATPRAGARANRYQIIIDTDGKPSLIPNAVRGSTSGMVIADNASHKTTVVDAYIVGKIGYGNFDSAAYYRCLIGWMATTTTAFWTGARWAIGLTDDSGMEMCRNATEVSAQDSSYPSKLPLTGARQTQWQCYHYNTQRQAFRVNDDLYWDDVTKGGSTSANVTYTGTGQIYIGCQAGVSANDGSTHSESNSSFRTIALWGTTRSDHASIASYLTTKWGVVGSYPTSWSSGDGFTWTPEYSGTFNLTGTNDANGLQYWFENPGFQDDGTRGPSMAKCNNINNSIDLFRTAIVPYDNEELATGAERCERGIRLGASGSIGVGNDFETYCDFLIEPGPTQTGSWCDIFQFHTNSGADADLCYASIKNDTLRIFTQRGGGEVQQSSAISFSRNTWYSIRFSGHLSGSTSDTLNVWFGPHGTTLTQIVSASGSLFPTASGGAYPKQGIYRGEPNAIDVPPNTNSGLIAVRWANQKFSKTIGAYASLVTTPSTLPTHA